MFTSLWGSRESLCQLTKTRRGMESDRAFSKRIRTMGAGKVDRRDEEGGRNERKKGTEE